MKKRAYTSEFKVKVVLEVLRGETMLGEIASRYQINPNQIGTWRKEFMEKASSIFDEPRKEREQKKAEKEAAEQKAMMLKTIGQLTMERDFLRAVQEKIDGKKELL